MARKWSDKRTIQIGALFAALLIVGNAPSLMAANPNESALYDLVIIGGRVLDPETGLDGVRNIGISDGKIKAVTDENIAGKRTVEASGLVVTPGFIDIHSHGQDIPSNRMQAFDGVTTALELEDGKYPLGKFYDAAAREGRPLNYGATAAWLLIRAVVLDGWDGSADHYPRRNSAKWVSAIATDEQEKKILDLLDQSIKEGALGIGVEPGYAITSGRKEYYDVGKLAAAHNIPVFTHLRFQSTEEPNSSFEGFEEAIAVAASTGAHFHLVHINSTSLRDISRTAELIKGAQQHGVQVDVEAYPYGAATSEASADIFHGPNWLGRLGVSASDVEYEGKPQTEESILSLQAHSPGGYLTFHFLRPETNPADQALLDKSVLFPGGAIASDDTGWEANGKSLTGDIWPLPENAYAHPRSAGTFSRFLRQYVRERQAISLIDAIRKMTLIPAQTLQPSVPQMARMGRIQVGDDADIDVFDLKTISDKATFAKPAQTSIGMHWVIVNGIPVIENGVLNRKAFPGEPIRRTPEL
jgi:N-acyl-D-glutamate deacylase